MTLIANWFFALINAMIPDMAGCRMSPAVPFAAVPVFFVIGMILAAVVLPWRRDR